MSFAAHGGAGCLTEKARREHGVALDQLGDLAKVHLVVAQQLEALAGHFGEARDHERVRLHAFENDAAQDIKKRVTAHVGISSGLRTLLDLRFQGIP